jgi:hypothetical protein
MCSAPNEFPEELAKHAEWVLQGMLMDAKPRITKVGSIVRLAPDWRLDGKKTKVGLPPPLHVGLEGPSISVERDGLVGRIVACVAAGKEKCDADAWMLVNIPTDAANSLFSSVPGYGGILAKCGLVLIDTRRFDVVAKEDLKPDELAKIERLDAYALEELNLSPVAYQPRDKVAVSAGLLFRLSRPGIVLCELRSGWYTVLLYEVGKRTKFFTFDLPAIVLHPWKDAE